MDKQFYVYTMASGRNGTLYLGVTSNLARRVYEHKNKIYEGFSKQYATENLVYYEVHQNVESAITREKQLKRWNRKENQVDRGEKSILA